MNVTERETEKGKAEEEDVAMTRYNLLSSN
jgi:hypothetical protein